MFHSLLIDCYKGAFGSNSAGSRGSTAARNHLHNSEYEIDEAGIIVRAFDKVKAAENPAQMLKTLE